MAVGRTLEAARWAGSAPVLTHQPRCPAPADAQPLVLQPARQARAAIRHLRQLEGRANMSEQHQVLSLTLGRGPALPREVAALADPQAFAQALVGEVLFRR